MPAEGAAPTGRLTTHVLDTARGRPAAGLAITLWAVEGEVRRLIRAARTNGDGRCDAPLLSGAEMQTGVYELTFEVGPYFRAAGTSLAEPLFLDLVPIRFGIADAGAHYHVPLLIYAVRLLTYRAAEGRNGTDTEQGVGGVTWQFLAYEWANFAAALDARHRRRSPGSARPSTSSTSISACASRADTCRPGSRARPGRCTAAASTTCEIHGGARRTCPRT